MGTLQHYILGFRYRSSADNVLHVPARSNSASTIKVTAFLLYTLDAITS